MLEHLSFIRRCSLLGKQLRPCMAMFVTKRSSGGLQSPNADVGPSLDLSEKLKEEDNLEMDHKNEKEKNRKQGPLVKITAKQLSRTRIVGSMVISLREIACVTMSQDLTLSSWQRFPIFETKSKKSSIMNIGEYYERISDSIAQFQTIPDLWILEKRFWKLSVPFLSSHFLITKAMLHCLLSELYDKHKVERIVYGPWNKTGHVFDIMVPGASSRKSGREKVTEIFQHGEWGGTKIKFSTNFIKIGEADILVKNKTEDLIEGEYEKVSEEMSDAFLQAVAFWTTLQKK
uniref:transcription elongation factor, mitochondrial-like n=1 Tax=Styela clava TaxID=7725 RepID=UPI0019397685|nr:transcription elongation factor, mitochondrial-like [Styela clava]